MQLLAEAHAVLLYGCLTEWLTGAICCVTTADVTTGVTHAFVYAWVAFCLLTSLRAKFTSLPLGAAWSGSVGYLALSTCWMFIAHSCCSWNACSSPKGAFGVMSPYPHGNGWISYVCSKLFLVTDHCCHWLVVSSASHQQTAVQHECLRLDQNHIEPALPSA